MPQPTPQNKPCSQCIYSIEDTGVKTDGFYGYCLRFPPIVHPPTSAMFKRFPPVKMDGTCGEWKKFTP